jgi:type I restriction enzyme M protein
MRVREAGTLKKNLDLFESEAGGEGQENLPETFRRIYYHLYSNSKASRAETIIEDLSLLLLSKLTAEMNGGKAEIASYLKGKGTANRVLLPMLRESFGELLGQRQTFSLGDDSLRGALKELAELDLTHAPAHALGEAFQALIGPRLRGEKGQFFTPKSLVRGMVEILDPQPGESVCDPACGTGGFLSETHIYQMRKYGKAKLGGALVGVDKDTGLSRLAGAMLKIIGKGRAHVYDFNSLDLGEWEEHLGRSVIGSFDVVMTNPPFGSRIGIKDEAILKQFDFGHIWTQGVKQNWVESGALCTSEDPQILFLELCVMALKPGGRMGIVLPEGVFGNKQSAYVWDWLERQGEVTALLDCPRTTFQPGTDTKTNVLFFRKLGENKKAGEGAKTKIAVALHCGHDRRGRSVMSSGKAQEDDFPAIARAFHAKDDERGLWRSVGLKGMRYLVPRYYYEEKEGSAGEQEITHGARYATLGELVRERTVSVRKGHEVGSDAYGTGEIPFVRTSDLSNFEISSDPTKAVGEDVYKVFGPQQKLTAGDVLIVVDGRYRIGMTAMLCAHNARCVVQSHLRIISSLRRDRLDPYELLFALNLPSVKLRIRSLVFIQSTLGTLGSRLLELKIPILHGDGPWAGRVARFRELLMGRAEMLRELQSMAGEDYEL